MSTPFLQIKGLRYRLGNHTLLDDVNYSAGEGNCIALLGANGAGKSTLLDICYGLTKPDAGQVRWFGHSIDNVRDDLSLVLQRPMFLNRSVSANLQYVLKTRGVPRRLRTGRIAQVLRRVGLDDKAGVSAYHLSGGEQKCLSIARAGLLVPRVMLLDEPTAQLDYVSEGRVERLILDMISEGVRIILTSHNLAQVQRMCDEVIFLDRGRVITCTTKHRFFHEVSHPAVRNFIKSQSLV